MPRTELSSSAGRLEALYDPPAASPPARGPRAAVVCHPHPLGGGSMQNKVVHALARVLAGRGLHVLRFNFRGAGGSDGAHDEGRGEADDVRSALDDVAARAGLSGPGSLVLAGYSFGAWVGSRVGLADERVAGVLAVAPPVNFYDFGALARTNRPVAVVYAVQDEIVPAAETRAWLDGFEHAPEIHAVDGAGHLFHGRLEAVRRAAEAFLDRVAVADAP